MRFTRREFVGLSAMFALSGCSSSKTETKKDEKEEEPKIEESKQEKPKEEQKQEEPKQEEQPQQIVTELTEYEVFRVDMRRGITGDVEVLTQNTTDFSGYYAILDPDNRFEMHIYDHDYNGHISLGDKTKHLYSGMDDYEVTRILFDGEQYANVGDTDIEGFYVDNYILIDMVLQVEGKTTFMTFYLWKKVEE